ncbi:MAG: GNAT family N-acetyltransferase [Pseudomonadota bacterium]
MKVRPAGQADLAQIVALLADDPLGAAREQPGHPAYEQAFAAMARDGCNLYLVAEEAGEILGCLQYTLIAGLSRRGALRAQIEGVRVAASHRGKGLGAALIQAAIARARADGAELVQLTSDRTRPEAHRFYEDHGFVASHTGFKLML